VEDALFPLDVISESKGVRVIMTISPSAKALFTSCDTPEEEEEKKKLMVMRRRRKNRKRRRRTMMLL
jgi:hypothetical protein